MPSFRRAVYTTFYGKDHMSEVFKRMGSAGTRYSRQVREGNKKLKASFMSIKNIAAGIVIGTAFNKGMSLISNGIRGVIDEFITFENALVSTASRMDITKNSPDYEKLERGIRAIGGSTEFTNTQVALAAEVLAQAGFKQVDIVETAVRSTSNLATIAKVDLADAMKISTKALDSFGMRTKDVNKNLENLTRINDALSRASDASTISITDMYETMKYVGSISKSAGSDIETFASLAGLVGLAAVEGTRAGTALAQVYTRLYDPVGDAAKILKKFNIQITDDKGDFLDRLQILAQFSDAFKDLGEQTRGKYLKEIFDQRALKAVIPLIDLGSEKILAYREDFINTGKSAVQKAGEMRQSIQNTLKVWDSKKIELGFKFIDKFRDKIPAAMESIGEFIDSIDVDAIWDKGSRVISIIENIIEKVKPFTPILEGIAVAFVAVKTAAFVAAIKAATVASLAFIFTPVGATLAAIAGMFAAYKSIKDNWDDLKRSVMELGEAINKYMIEKLLSFMKLLQGSFIGKALKKVLNIDLDVEIKKIDEALYGDERRRKATIERSKEIYDIMSGSSRQSIPQINNNKSKTKNIKQSFFNYDNGPIVLPNRRELQQQSVNLRGEINFKNAPEGASFKKQDWPSPQLSVSGLGVSE
jgi:TP901 family phage tail tape measure protein